MIFSFCQQTNLDKKKHGVPKKSNQSVDDVAFLHSSHLRLGEPAGSAKDNRC